MATWDENWVNAPDIAALIAKRAKSEETTSANAGAFERPLGKKVLRQPIPKIPPAAGEKQSDVEKYTKGKK